VKDDGKIVFRGCKVGKPPPHYVRSPYGQLVADASGRTTYASDQAVNMGEYVTYWFLTALEYGASILPRFEPKRQK
jgi:hypothetical protein